MRDENNDVLNNLPEIKKKKIPFLLISILGIIILIVLIKVFQIDVRTIFPIEPIMPKPMIPDNLIAII